MNTLYLLHNQQKFLWQQKVRMPSSLPAKLPWLLLSVLTGLLIWYFVTQAKVQFAGDIAEYYGITQSLIYDQSIHLSAEQQSELEKNLHKAYFSDPGYYIKGRDGNRYPVHFFVYSIITTPFRILLKAFGIHEVRSLYITNITSFIVMIAVIWRRYVKQSWPRIVILNIALASPLMSLFIWPGPDMWYMGFLIIAFFAFGASDLLLAALLVAIASWHSQPLIVLSALLCVYSIYQQSYLHITKNDQKFSINLKAIFFSVCIGVIALIPYMYNLYAFAALTPWTQIRDGWTLIHGFGLHNASVWKLYEQLFDLNIGQFWFAPLIFIFGSLYFVYTLYKRRWGNTSLLIFTVITAFFYQTNPGWHYGNPGYGPGRHGLLFLALFIYFAHKILAGNRRLNLFLLSFLIITQLAILSTNNHLQPDLTKTHFHTVFAQTILNSHPEWYTPTPEIFVDRTNHTDLTLPTTAIYKDGNRCRKAYVLFTDLAKVEAECGPLSDNHLALLDNEFLRTANYNRKTIITEATFWPDAGSCAPNFQQTDTKPFICANDIVTFSKLTNIADLDRIQQLNTVGPGVWKLSSGEPILVTVPSGYIIHHQSFDGTYLNF